MRHFITSLLVALSLMTALSSRADVVINSTNFPDANFRSWLQSQSYGSDGKLTTAELNSITEINVSNCNIADLTGIQQFSKLRILDCHGNLLSRLDLSFMEELERVVAHDNPSLTLLNAWGCYELQTLYCYNCSLTELGLVDCESLSELICSGNQLTDLDLSSCSNALTNLNCSMNQIAVLGLATAYKLTQLECSSNKLTVLGMYNKPVLRSLDCSDNELTSLTVGNCPLLTEVYCAGNRLEEVDFDFSGNTVLDYIECSGNRLSDASFESIIGSLPSTTNGRLMVYKSGIGDENHYTNKNDFHAKRKGWTAYQWFLYNDRYVRSEYTGDSVGFPIDAAHFPDANFRALLIRLPGYGTDEFFTFDELSSVYSLELSNANISSLEGIGYFTALESLNCDQNNLTELNLANNPQLRTLSCSNNSLSTLDLSQQALLTEVDCHSNEISFTVNLNTEAPLQMLDCSDNHISYLNGLNYFTGLKELRCNNNSFTYLGVWGNPALEILNCSDNQLTELDLSRNPALKGLLCSNNRLNSLDLTHCPELLQVYCERNYINMPIDFSSNSKLYTVALAYNNIGPSAMMSTIASMPLNDYSYGDNGFLVYSEERGNSLEGPLQEHNQVDMEMLCYARSKGWRLFYYKKYLDAHDLSYKYQIERCPLGVSLDATHFPDAIIRELIAYDDLDNDGYLNESELGQVEDLDWVGCGDISDLTGCNYFFANKYLSLSTIDLSGNTYKLRSGSIRTMYIVNANLSSIDLSSCHALRYIDVSQNNLTAIDFSGNKLLRYVGCINNNIREEDMDAMIASLPTVDSGELYAIAESGELNRITPEQVEQALSKGWTTYTFETGVGYVPYDGYTFIKGDANDDRSVDVVDISAIVNYLGEVVLPTFTFEAADVNNDNLVNVVDITGVVNIINGVSLSAPRMMAPSLLDGDYLAGRNCSLDGACRATVAIDLNSQQNYTAFQLDVTLDEGTTLDGAQLSSRTGDHLLHISPLGGNTYRLVSYSLSNDEITAGEGTLLTLDLVADGAISGGVMAVDNIVFATSDMRCNMLNPFSLVIGDATGIESIGTEVPAVAVSGNGIRVTTPVATTVTITTLTGVTRQLSVSAGTTELTLDRGIYIVTVNGRSTKVRM